MSNQRPPTIQIAAALIDDDAGHLPLVRKAGTEWFMQTGGKIEAGKVPSARFAASWMKKSG